MGTVKTGLQRAVPSGVAKLSLKLRLAFRLFDVDISKIIHHPQGSQHNLPGGE